MRVAVTKAECLFKQRRILKKKRQCQALALPLFLWKHWICQRVWCEQMLTTFAVTFVQLPGKSRPSKYPHTQARTHAHMLSVCLSVAVPTRLGSGLGFARWGWFLSIANWFRCCSLMPALDHFAAIDQRAMDRIERVTGLSQSVANF